MCIKYTCIAIIICKCSLGHHEHLQMLTRSSLGKMLTCIAIIKVIMITRHWMWIGLRIRQRSRYYSYRPLDSEEEEPLTIESVAKVQLVAYQAFLSIITLTPYYVYMTHTWAIHVRSYRLIQLNFLLLYFLNSKLISQNY